jgi:alanyl-tRNA synthetase
VLRPKPSNSNALEADRVVNKIYIDDPYRPDCESIVTDVRSGRVFLQDTVFYPEGGGQVGDTGWIGDSRIVDTQKVGGRPFAHPDFPDMIMFNGDVGHTLADDTPRPEVGAPVPVRVDWERRLCNMRHHSAAHLGFWFATTARPDLYTKGARIDDKTARFDFNASERLDADQVAEWEHLANEVIAKDLEILTLPVDGQHEARIWRSGDMSIPCGGTHVRSTGEIGVVKMRSKRQGNNLERLYITIVELAGSDG